MLHLLTFGLASLYRDRARCRSNGMCSPVPLSRIWFSRQHHAPMVRSNRQMFVSLGVSDCREAGRVQRRRSAGRLHYRAAHGLPRCDPGIRHQSRGRRDATCVDPDFDTVEKHSTLICRIEGARRPVFTNRQQSRRLRVCVREPYCYRP